MADGRALVKGALGAVRLESSNAIGLYAACSVWGADAEERYGAISVL